MNRKSEWIWLGTCVAVSSLLVGFVTGFKFSAVELQIYDGHFTFSVFSATVNGALVLYTLRSGYLLMEILTTRYPILAIIAAIVNPLVALLLIVFLGAWWPAIFLLSSQSSGPAMMGSLLPFGLTWAFVAFQIYVEVRIVRKMSRLFDSVSRHSTRRAKNM